MAKNTLKSCSTKLLRRVLSIRNISVQSTIISFFTQLDHISKIERALQISATINYNNGLSR